MSKYIIFKTDSASARGWEERSLSHTEVLTDILYRIFKILKQLQEKRRSLCNQ
ncbi:MAG: hypothetical protein AAGA60_27800 [Cyanobacteria bacterium P01_E01_bin.42]